MTFSSCSYPEYTCVSKEILFIHFAVLKAPIEQLYAKPPMQQEGHFMTLLNIDSDVSNGYVAIPDGTYVIVKILQCYTAVS